MSTGKNIVIGCALLPVLLVASCAGKMQVDRLMYNLPGEVLKSPIPPTHKFASAEQVAKALDSYVQPRFEILRDKNFGAMRIVYRKHAGIVQLKVESPQEKEQIANINAANRDYSISLLRCAKVPDRRDYTKSPRLELLYFNQKPVATDWEYYRGSASQEVAKTNGLDWEALSDKTMAALPQLRKGKPFQTVVGPHTVLICPVRATEPSCISCHTESKIGDTLGAMVYTVRTLERAGSKTTVAAR